LAVAEEMQALSRPNPGGYYETHPKMPYPDCRGQHIDIVGGAIPMGGSIPAGMTLAKLILIKDTMKRGAKPRLDPISLQERSLREPCVHD
jgi:hypothetical protein